MVAPLHPRLLKLQQRLADTGLDAVLLMSPAVTTYLSGSYLLTQTVIPEREAYVLLTRDGAALYLVCNIEENMARAHSWIRDVETYVEFQEAPAAAAGRWLIKLGLHKARIGVEANALPAAGYQQLQHDLPGCAFIPWDRELAQIMMVKEPDEVAALAKAGQRTQAAITRALLSAPPGNRENEVFAAMMDSLMQQGMFPLFNVFTSGPNTLLVHGQPGDRILQPGDLIRLDVGGRWPSHYLSDMARTAVVGSPSQEQAANYHKLVQAQMTTIAAVQPGRPVSDLYHICAQSYAEQGIPFHMPHIGHSMGIGLHEHPLIHSDEKTLLQPGMVLNIEPFLADLERGEGYHVEDLVMVTETGYRLLTDPTPELIQLAV